MKAGNVMRAMVLLEARASIDAEFQKQLRRNKPAESWDFFGMRIGLASIGLRAGDDFGGADAGAWLDIDIETARLLLPTLIKLIDDELVKLGVEPTADPPKGAE